ncbi:hypothetical protein TrCOL_g10594 [Triparma columacea]|uniref:Clp1 P-loop domain-containing protein n=1 Tax=Triparma columacea TaxID=722753 RepID=A0A9W7GA51_9STRA|nr:hypothetical protein TrCOL_g10594 [Triparma columacea]
MTSKGGKGGKITASSLGDEGSLTIAEPGDCCGCSFSPDWNSTSSSCLGGGRIAVVGPKNVGKTTLVKTLANFLMTSARNRGDVWILDVDPGRPVEGFRRACSFTKWRGEGDGGKGWIEGIEQGGNIIYYGGLTCKVDPTLLVSCVRRLLSSTPLLRHDTILVNTQGWVKSLGLVVLGEVLDAVGVDRVIKIGGVEGVEGMVIEKNEMAKEKRDTITDTERYLNISGPPPIYAVSLSELTIEVSGSVVTHSIARRLLDNGVEVGLVDAQGWCRGMGIVEKVEEVKGEGLGGGIAYVRTPVNEDVLKGAVVRMVFGGVVKGREGGGGKEVWGEETIGEGGMASRNNIQRKRLGGGGGKDMK